jgi:hypothetical protein
MSIDFSKEESRNEYLSQKLDDLLSEINNFYGKELLDELTFRLEKTISDFNEEVQILLDQLKDSTDQKDRFLNEIKESDN